MYYFLLFQDINIASKTGDTVSSKRGIDGMSQPELMAELLKTLSAKEQNKIFRLI